MGWSGGTYTRQGAVHSGSELWQDSAGDGDATISSSEHDTHDEDLASGINACLNKDGSNAMTGDMNAGSNVITLLAAGAATGNSGRWDEDVSGVSLDGTTLHIEYNGAKADVTVDLASVGSSGEVTISGDQTITGKKTFTTNTTPITDLRILDTSYRKVNVLTAAANVAVDVTANSTFFLANDQAMTLTFTFPAASADTDLGANFSTQGAILMRNETGHGAITILGTATDGETIGSRPTGAGELYCLVYQVWIMGSTTYALYTWVTA